MHRVAFILVHTFDQCFQFLLIFKAGSLILVSQDQFNNFVLIVPDSCSQNSSLLEWLHKGRPTESVNHFFNGVDITHRCWPVKRMKQRSLPVLFQIINFESSDQFCHRSSSFFCIHGLVCGLTFQCFDSHFGFTLTLVCFYKRSSFLACRRREFRNTRGRFVCLRVNLVFSVTSRWSNSLNMLFEVSQSCFQVLGRG